MDNGNTKKIFFVAAFPGSVGGLDLYTAEYSNGVWGKPKNLGKAINTTNNESNPGLLNDHTLTYSSGGIIKKLDLNTLKVVDLEETNVSDKKITETISNKPEKKKDQEMGRYYRDDLLELNWICLALEIDSHLLFEVNLSYPLLRQFCRM